MTTLDWLVLIGTLAFIGIYGAWKSRGVTTVDDYLRAGNTLRWPTIGLSIMATQASAITFLSTPGQAYEDGMRFVQFYLGLPLAMIVIAAVFVPIYHRLQVYTAYEYLGHRFDGRVRTLGAMLFLIQRGLAAGITIYAPSIIVSTIMGWPLHLTNAATGLFVIAYTVSGGTRAVAQTQKQQMIVMLGGMALAGVVIAWTLPAEVSLPGAVQLAGALDRFNPINFHLDFENRYTIWSGLAGGFFLALAYFGTDQSQVGRYLAGRSVAESRLGLLFNGLFKIPMQFGILFVGILVFVFFQFTQPPLFFNTPALEAVRGSSYAAELETLQHRYDAAFATQRAAATTYLRTLDDRQDPAAAKHALRSAFQQSRAIRSEAQALIARANPTAEKNDTDYIFISFVLRYLPSGLVGLLLAVIFCAAMSSTSSELTALGSTTMIDLYKRRSSAAHSSAGQPTASPSTTASDLRLSKLFTVLWGLAAVAFATFYSLLDNLIQAVNIIGSIFYGTLLGLFVVAFFFKRITATPVLVGALVAQTTVIILFFASDLGFLWFNVIGCGIVVAIAALLQALRRNPPGRRS